MHDPIEIFTDIVEPLLSKQQNQLEHVKFFKTLFTIEGTRSTDVFDEGNLKLILDSLEENTKAICLIQLSLFVQHKLSINIEGNDEFFDMAIDTFMEYLNSTRISSKRHLLLETVKAVMSKNTPLMIRFIEILTLNLGIPDSDKPVVRSWMTTLTAANDTKFMFDYCSLLGFCLQEVIKTGKENENVLMGLSNMLLSQFNWLEQHIKVI